jgi:threonine/homoserine/homoserine lactone efflux protein
MPHFDPTTLALFLTVGLALNLTPGPDMLFCLASGVAGGRRAGIVAALGVASGAAVHTLAAALGLAGLLLAFPLAFEAIRWAGAAYLAWLAVRTWRDRPAGPATEQAHVSLREVYLRGMLTNLLNPKVALFFLALLPQFIRPEAGPVAIQALVLGSLMNVTGTVVNAAVGASAGTIGRLLRRWPAIARLQNRVVGGIFMALAARLALASR